MKLLALLLLGACASAPDPAVHASALSTEDARPTLQSQIDAATAKPDGGTVLLAAGRWTLTRAPIGSYNRFAALSTHGHNLTLRGVGPETVLELAGDQGGQSIAVISIDPGAEHVLIADLTIDTTAATNTDEQTHAIATSGVCAGATCLPIRDLQIERVTFRHPRNTDSRKGDCLRVLGGTDQTQLVGLRVVGCNFGACARSAVMIQRGVVDAVLVGNTFSATKTCVDGEATGGYDARITISNNAFLPGCSPALSLTNFQGGVVSGNTLASNLTVYRSTGVAITGNRIEYAATGDTGAIDVANVCDGLAITGNAIARSGSHGPAIKLVPHSGGVCQHVTITGNTIRQDSVDGGIYLESVSHAVVAGNHVAFSVPSIGYSGIYDRSVLGTAPITGLAISGNTISGPITYGVTLDGAPGTFGGGIAITGNVATGTVFGLRVNNSQGFTVPIASSGNALGPSAYGSARVEHGD